MHTDKVVMTNEPVGYWLLWVTSVTPQEWHHHQGHIRDSSLTASPVTRWVEPCMCAALHVWHYTKSTSSYSTQIWHLEGKTSGSNNDLSLYISSNQRPPCHWQQVTGADKSPLTPTGRLSHNISWEKKQNKKRFSCLQFMPVMANSIHPELYNTG